MSPRRQRLQALLMVSPPIVVVAVFIGFPVVVAVLYTLGYTGGPNSVIASLAQHQYTATGARPTTATYREVLASTSFLQNLVATVWVTVVTIMIVLALSWGIALYLRLTGSRLSKIVSALSVIPLFIPVVIASYSILTFYEATGFIRSVGHHLGWESTPTLGYTLGAVIIGEIWVNLPFGVLMMSSGLNGVPNSLIEAARDSGASRVRTTVSILVPMNLIPSVIVATFTGIYVLGSFTVPYLTGPSSPTLLGPAMNNTFSSFNEPQQAEVMAVAVFLLAAGIGSAYVWANFRAAKQSGAV